MPQRLASAMWSKTDREFWVCSAPIKKFALAEMKSLVSLIVGRESAIVYADGAIYVQGFELRRLVCDLG
jgi:hypothetical protein